MNDAHRRWAARLAVPTIAIVLGFFAGAAPAWAHSRLEHTDPADGATVKTQLTAVTLTFNEMVHGQFTTVVVTGPGGVTYSKGHVQVIDDDVHQAVYPMRSGAYTVAWRAISADGHPVEGQFHFQVALAPGDEPTAGPPSLQPGPNPGAARGGGGGGSRLGLWGGAAAVLVVVVLVIVFTRRRTVNLS